MRHARGRSRSQAAPSGRMALPPKMSRDTEVETWWEQVQNYFIATQTRHRKVASALVLMEPDVFANVHRLRLDLEQQQGSSMRFSQLFQILMDEFGDKTRSQAALQELLQLRQSADEDTHVFIKRVTTLYSKLKSSDVLHMAILAPSFIGGLRGRELRSQLGVPPNRESWRSFQELKNKAWSVAQILKGNRAVGQAYRRDAPDGARGQPQQSPQ